MTKIANIESKKKREFNLEEFDLMVRALEMKLIRMIILR